MLWVSIFTAAALLILGMVLYVFGIYNNLIQLSRTIDQSFANIDVILKQRWDEIPNIANTCKAYMKHERELFESIARLRDGYDDAKNTDEKVGLENELTRTLDRLRFSLEAYPKLKADRALLRCQSRISELEAEIADRRELFNESVTRHNIYIDQFPPLLVSRPLGYRQRSPLQIPEAERNVVPGPLGR